MNITFFILCIITAFYLGFKTKAYFLSNYEKTQHTLYLAKQFPKRVLKSAHQKLIAQYRTRKILPRVVELAEQGDTHSMWILYKAKKKQKVYYTDISLHYPFDNIEKPDSFITVFGTFWKTEEWLEKLVQASYWPAMIEKSRLLLKEGNLEKNKTAIFLLEQIKQGMGYNFVEACQILTPIFKEGITGVPANPKKYKYYAQFDY